MTSFTGAAALAIAAFAVVTAGAQQRDAQHAGHTAPAVGSKVTLSSCVERGDKADTFILTRTADVPVHPATHGRVVYWLDDARRLRAHVGHEVRVIGTITDVKQGEMEVTLGADPAGGWTVEIEAPGRDVRSSPSKAGVDAAARQSGSTDIRTTLVKLKVEEVTMAAAKCKE
jgi:hypothetical protein